MEVGLTERLTGLPTGAKHDLLAARVLWNVVGHVVYETVDYGPTVLSFFVLRHLLHFDCRQTGHIEWVLRFFVLRTTAPAASSALLLLLVRVRVDRNNIDARRAGLGAVTAVAECSSVRVISMIYVYDIDASWSAPATSSFFSRLLNFLRLGISVFRVSLHHFDYT